MATVFKPTRAEPFFDPTPEFDTSKLRITVVWQNYLDLLGDGVNEVDDDLEFEISSVESEIQQVQAFTGEISKRIDQLQDESFVFGQLVAKIHELEKKLSNLEQLVE